MSQIDDLFQQADQQFRAGNVTQADLYCTQILRDDPNHAEAIHLRGLILQRHGKHAQAAELFQKAIAINPDAVGFHNNLGVALQSLGRLDEAVAAYLRALKIKPGLAHVQTNLNRALADLERNKTGVPRATDADANAHNDRGIALYNEGDLPGSLAEFQKAVALRPSLAAAWNNLANILRYQGDLARAVDAYRRAISIEVDYPDAHQGLGMALLQMGDFAQGWLEYEWRWKVKTAQPRKFAQPRWCGEDLIGKSIFVHEEQGFGDAIQFFRYAGLLAERGGRLIVGCRKELARLLGEIPGVSRVVVSGQAMPVFDVHCPIMSLPMLFDTRVETVPAKIPYFGVPADRSATWRERVGATKRLNVGVAWAGNPELGTNRLRSIDFRALDPFGRVANVTYHSLQITPVSSAGDAAQLLIKDHSPLLTDFAETAALISNLDVVISVDTAVAHLAGALGKPTWIMIPAIAPDWRWMLNREDTPWYPTARLFRQKTPGDWKDVVERIAEQLLKMALA
jgi:tetratricopeptide (TPR) repeat protein